MMKKLFSLLLVMVFVSAGAFAWEITNEKNAHEVINGAAVGHFLNTFQDVSKYKLNSLDQTSTYIGVAWHTGLGMAVSPNNVGIVRAETFRNWVGIGGVDADIDSANSEAISTSLGWKTLEKPLRHFYDPVNSKTWLTDGNALLEWKVGNPEIDHVQWALHNPSHHWTFDQGLLLYRTAMEAGTDVGIVFDDSRIYDFAGWGRTNDSFRENLFAAAFRALGETLHGIGDMCLPAHVRDDSHGGQLITGNDTYLSKIPGGVDPVESVIGFLEASTIVNGSLQAPSSVSLSGKSVKDLMLECARYTNREFFSNDSICDPAVKGDGKDWKITGRSLSGKTYLAPHFDDPDMVREERCLPVYKRIMQADGEYHDLPFGVATYVVSVSKRFAGASEPVPMAMLSLAGFFNGIPEYYVPVSAAISQAKILIPLAVVAGAEAIDRFFPTMELTMKIDGDEVTASLTHLIDKDVDWKILSPGRPIRYCGSGLFQVNGTTRADVTFKDGVMVALTGQTLKADDQVQIIVKAGGLVMKSSLQKPPTPKAMTWVFQGATTNVTANPTDTMFTFSNTESGSSMSWTEDAYYDIGLGQNVPEKDYAAQAGYTLSSPFPATLNPGETFTVNLNVTLSGSPKSHYTTVFAWFGTLSGNGATASYDKTSDSYMLHLQAPETTSGTIYSIALKKYMSTTATKYNLQTITYTYKLE